MNIMKISSVITYIDCGYLMPLPFEHYHNWSSDQVGIYLSSLYRGFPSGGFVFWNPSGPLPSPAPEMAPQQINYIVDGLQRITAIYGALTGKPPPFFPRLNVENWPRFFHVEREGFSSNPGIGGDPFCIDLVAFFHGEHGAGSALAALHSYASAALPMSEIARRVTSLQKVKDRSIPVEDMPREFTLSDCLEFRAMTPQQAC